MEELSSELKSKILTIDGEKALTYRRQHWIVLLPQIAITLAFGLSFLVLLIISLSFGPTAFILILISFVLIGSGLLLYDYRIYSDWKNRLFIITNKKITIVDISDTKISGNREIIWEPVKETGIEVRLPGWLGRRFNYGDVTVTFDTSSRIEPITFEQIPDPEEFRKSLEDAKYEQ